MKVEKRKSVERDYRRGKIVTPEKEDEKIED